MRISVTVLSAFPGISDYQITTNTQPVQVVHLDASDHVTVNDAMNVVGVLGAWAPAKIWVEATECWTHKLRYNDR